VCPFNGDDEELLFFAVVWRLPATREALLRGRSFGRDLVLSRLWCVGKPSVYPLIGVY